jgi:hypothetical protein
MHLITTLLAVVLMSDVQVAMVSRTYSAKVI